MKSISLGIIREGKNPPDKRVPFTPQQAQEIEQRYPHVKVIVQSSNVRAFKDEEYANLGLDVREDMSECDILMGIKEVQIPDLIADKTYLFFSHTIKKQPYNKKLLQEVLKKNIGLIDYETLKDKLGNRLVAFGRFAGIVGAYNGILTYGKRYNQFTIRRAFECFDINDLKIELRKVKLPAVKVILTGAGRVAKGAMETLDTVGIRKVSADDFVNKTYDEPVYVQLSSADYHERKDGGKFNREEFHHHPEVYKSTFGRFTRVADILLAGAYWNPKAPVLFTKEEMRQPDLPAGQAGFKIKVIADITCDINGSVPSTVRSSTIVDPLYDYDPISETDKPALSNDKHITVMAVDNLPCELPRSASEEFGRDLIDKILPALIIQDVGGVIKRAKITKEGHLTENFEYLKDYVV